jgi:WD40 repeat protein
VQDHQVRLWDLRSTQCQGLVNCPGPATAAFDQQGLVFCIGSDSGVLKLYDVRSYDKGPFDTFAVSVPHLLGLEAQPAKMCMLKHCDFVRRCQNWQTAHSRSTV